MIIRSLYHNLNYPHSSTSVQGLIRPHTPGGGESASVGRCTEATNQVLRKSRGCVWLVNETKNFLLLEMAFSKKGRLAGMHLWDIKSWVCAFLLGQSYLFICDMVVRTVKMPEFEHT